MQPLPDLLWSTVREMHLLYLKFAVTDDRESTVVKQKTPCIEDGVLSIQEFVVSDQLNVDYGLPKFPPPPFYAIW